MTSRERLLMIAADLAPGFDLDALACAARDALPELFGMRGRPSECDTRRVNNYLHDHTGLKRQGLLQPAGRPGRYRLSPLGLGLVRRLRDPQTPPPDALAPLRAADVLARRLLDVFGGMPTCLAMTTRQDARRFWIAGGGHVRIREKLRDLLRQMGDDGLAALSDGRLVTSGTVRALLNVNEHLAGRFSRGTMAAV